MMRRLRAGAFVLAEGALLYVGVVRSDPKYSRVLRQQARPDRAELVPDVESGRA